MLRLFDTSLTAIALGLLVSSCGGSSDGGTPPSTVTIAKTSTGNGDGQTGQVGQALDTPLQVVVTDADIPSAGVTVNWATPSGGSLAPASTTTNADGVASTTWTLGT